MGKAIVTIENMTLGVTGGADKNSAGIYDMNSRTFVTLLPVEHGARVFTQKLEEEEKETFVPTDSELTIRRENDGSLRARFRISEQREEINYFDVEKRI